MGPEKIFENKVKSFLEEEGAYFVKYFANRNTRSGVPDILACVNGYFVAIEVKAQSGTVKDLQIYHIEQIRNAGGFAFALYPSAFDKFKQFIYGLNCDRYDSDMPLIWK